MFHSKEGYFFTICCIYFLIGIQNVAGGKTRLFTIISNTTIERKFENAFSDIFSYNTNSPSPSYESILKKYLAKANKENAEMFEAKRIDLPNLIELNDAYINMFNDNFVAFENVTYTNFENFQTTPAEVEAKSSDVSGKETLQIISTLKAEVMTLTGSLRYFYGKINHTFVLNLTNPTFQIKKVMSKLNDSQGIKTELQQETFSYDTMSIKIRPVDILYVDLKQAEVKKSILLRIADTWLIPIARSLEIVMGPKILKYRTMLGQNHRKILPHEICDFVKNYQNDITITNSTNLTITNLFFKSYESVSLSNVSKFSDCGGDSMSVKMKSKSGKKYLQHTISVVMEYSSSTSSLKWSKRKYYSYSDEYDDELYRPTPASYKSCLGTSVQRIEVKIYFQTNYAEEKIDKISSVDVIIETEDLPEAVCSQQDKYDVEEYVEKYLSNQVERALKEIYKLI